VVKKIRAQVNTSRKWKSGEAVIRSGGAKRGRGWFLEKWGTEAGAEQGGKGKQSTYVPLSQKEKIKSRHPRLGTGPENASLS